MPELSKNIKKNSGQKIALKKDQKWELLIDGIKKFSPKISEQIKPEWGIFLLSGSKKNFAQSLKIF